MLDSWIEFLYELFINPVRSVSNLCCFVRLYAYKINRFSVKEERLIFSAFVCFLLGKPVHLDISVLRPDAALSLKQNIFRILVTNLEHTMDVSMEKMKFSICAAVEQNYGIASKGSLPWPNIKKDVEYYQRLTARRNDPSKYVINIKGRLTYETSSLGELSRPGVHTVIVSTKYRTCPPNAYAVVPSFEAALNLIQTPPLSKEVDSVWVMGGQRIYEESIHSPLCHRIYLTKIFGSYQCDRFFPEFESWGCFKEVRDPNVDCSIQEENNIKFQFRVYERL